MNDAPSYPEVQSTTVTAPAGREITDTAPGRTHSAPVFMLESDDEDGDFYDCSDHFVEDDDYYHGIPYSSDATLPYKSHYIGVQNFEQNEAYQPQHWYDEEMNVTSADCQFHDTNINVQNVQLTEAYQPQLSYDQVNLPSTDDQIHDPNTIEQNTTQFVPGCYEQPIDSFYDQDQVPVNTVHCNLQNDLPFDENLHHMPTKVHSSNVPWNLQTTKMKFLCKI